MTLRRFNLICAILILLEMGAMAGLYFAFENPRAFEKLSDTVPHSVWMWLAEK